MDVKRLFDICFSLVLIIILSIPMLFIAILVKLTSVGPTLHWSKRVGCNNTIFWMPKFRTMKINTPIVATHLLSSQVTWITPIGTFLRKSSIDEFPQFFTILSGKMSVVGPRPALYNQEDLITLRTAKGIHLLKPGLTGMAQVNGRDELPVQIDRKSVV